MPSPITIRKLNLNHELMWSYLGRVLERVSTQIVLEAHFNRATSDAGYVVFEHNDRFVEYFFTDRWYNIFEIHSVQDDHLKGWYCNIAQPAIFSTDEIAQVDLALDLWIDPAGAYQVLDQDEFDALPLDAETRQHANAALDTLLGLLAQRAHPFDALDRPA